MDYLLSTNCLTKQYGKYKAASDISLHIKRGDIYGLIGRNGAGKTTILKMFSGLAAPTRGEYSIFGKSGKAADAMKSRIGTLIEQPGLYLNMTAAENLTIKCLALGVHRRGYVEDLLRTVGLAEVKNKKTKQFSLGMKQRLGIALALVGDPDLIVLDEPINGLDPQGIVEVRETLARLNKERDITIIISSHILEELSKLATKYGIIHNGVLLQELTREELLAQCREHIDLHTTDTEKTCAVLEGMGISQYKVFDKSSIQIFERFDETGDITMALALNGIKTTRIAVKGEALEDYYLNLTGGGAHA